MLPIQVVEVDPVWSRPESSAVKSSVAVVSVATFITVQICKSAGNFNTIWNEWKWRWFSLANQIIYKYVYFRLINQQKYANQLEISIRVEMNENDDDFYWLIKSSFWSNWNEKSQNSNTERKRVNNDPIKSFLLANEPVTAEALIGCHNTGGWMSPVCKWARFQISNKNIQQSHQDVNWSPRPTIGWIICIKRVSPPPFLPLSPLLLLPPSWLLLLLSSSLSLLLFSIIYC